MINSSRNVAIIAIGIILIATIVLAFAFQPQSYANRWIPDELETSVAIQVAYNDESIFLRAMWEVEKASWYHDYAVFEGGRWVRYGSSPVGPDPTGTYEDRFAVMIDDGTVKGFDKFGGWLLVHEGMRFLDSEASSEEVLESPLSRSDVRHYIPQSREGEWWEDSWDKLLSKEEIDDLKRKGVFIDLWQWRAHRSNPVGYVDDGYSLEYRHSDNGLSMFSSNSFDPENGPQFMFDPEKLGFAALEFEKIKNQEYSQDDIYYLLRDSMVPFDSSKMFEGAAIPLRILREPNGSRGFEGSGRFENNYWTVNMKRPLDTGYEDDKTFVEGKAYTVAFGVHKRSTGSRWHYISYPYELRLGLSDADIVGVYIDEDEPDWNQIPAKEIPLIYPGQTTWTWLTSKAHPGYAKVRNNTISIWDIHPEPINMARASLLREDPIRGIEWIVVISALVVFVACVIIVQNDLANLRRTT